MTLINGLDNWLDEPYQQEMDRRVAEPFGVDPGVEDATEPVWIIFDGRAMSGNTDDASVLESFGVDSAKDDKAAIRYAKDGWIGYEFALYRYDLSAKKKRQANDERLIHVQNI